MKTLYLVRHASAKLNTPGLGDRERPLTTRGEGDAHRVAERLTAAEDLPQQILSSPAVRALSTAHILAQGIPQGESIVEIEDAIYEASLEQLLEVVHGLPDTTSSVLITGHNPGISELLDYLAPGDTGHMPTCSVAELRYHGNHWTELGHNTCTLTKFSLP